MDQFHIYIALLGITVFIGMLFNKTTIPTPLLLVIAGMLISLVPHIPRLELKPDLVLNVFLPLLIYTASAQFSWRDVKDNIRPILLLSIGHVIFITIIVAMMIHYLIPSFSWPMAFLLGAVISPPDDAAILAILDKVRMPHQVVTILKGESMLNDATALIIFRFSLVAVLTHHFAPVHAFLAFLVVIIGETLYGIILGHLLGQIRLRIEDPILQMMVSILAPFLAYLPAEKLGGCGVLATAVTGFVIGHCYLEQFSPNVRLISNSFWTTTAFAVQSILFLLIGLNFHYILEEISTIPWGHLFTYSSLIILTVIIGRFIWVFPCAYIPRLLFPRLRKKDPYPAWQLPFIVSWAGMRGSISLAAAMAVPLIPTAIKSTNPRDLLIFLVFSVITATLLLQGLTLPWILKIIGVRKIGQHEQFHDHLAELSARKEITQAALNWLLKYQQQVKDNHFLHSKIEVKILEYQTRLNHLTDSIDAHKSFCVHDEEGERYHYSFISEQINKIERNELSKLWHKKKISYHVRNKILQQLDYRAGYISK